MFSIYGDTLYKLRIVEDAFDLFSTLPKSRAYLLLISQVTASVLCCAKSSQWNTTFSQFNIDQQRYSTLSLTLQNFNGDLFILVVSCHDESKRALSKLSTKDDVMSVYLPLVFGVQRHLNLFVFAHARRPWCHTTDRPQLQSLKAITSTTIKYTDWVIDQPHGQNPLSHNPLTPFFVAVCGSVSVRTRLVGRIGSGVPVADRQSRFLPTSTAFNAVRGVSIGILPWHLVWKTRMVWLPFGEKNWRYIYIRFNIIYKLDGQTDWWTPHDGIGRASRGKN